MEQLKYLFNAINYGFYCFYSFTLIDVITKLSFGNFELTNLTNLFQLILTIIGVFFAYAKYKTYCKDSAIKTKMLAHEEKEKEIALWYLTNKLDIDKNLAMFKKFKKEFIEPFEEENLNDK